jgi:hypothetical protein
MNMTTEKIKENRVGKIIKKVLEKTMQRFENPDEVRKFLNGKLELIKINGISIGKSTLEPGWKWSISEPLLNTLSLKESLFQYHLSGILKIAMKDGTQFEFKEGDISRLPAGQHAWVAGDEPVVTVDFQAIMKYAKQNRNL